MQLVVLQRTINNGDNPGLIPGAVTIRVNRVYLKRLTRGLNSSLTHFFIWTLPDITCPPLMLILMLRYWHTQSTLANN